MAEYKEIENLLEDAGWFIECESPLEIYHPETNSRATGLAAKHITTYLELKSSIEQSL